jgi:uncharacterized protein
VRSRRRSREDAAELAGSFAQLLAPLTVVDEQDLREGLDLFGRVERLGAFDAVLAATALRRDARAFVSADRAFAHVERLAYIDPADTDFPGSLVAR